MPNPDRDDKSRVDFNEANGTLHVEVCYALPDVQVLIDVSLPAGATIRDAIEASGILVRYPQIDLNLTRVGVFGRLETLQTKLSQFDRVEIYRSLVVDPKLARQRRVEKIRASGSVEGRKWTRKEIR